ncbi:MAG TPA: hypothetical protein VF339_14110 [Gammaproteobacteria bacterium]
MVGTYNSMLANLQRDWLRLGEQRGFLERFLKVTPVGIVISDFETAACRSGIRARAARRCTRRRVRGAHTRRDRFGRAATLDRLEVDQDRSQIDQVMINVVKNAASAVGVGL